MLQKEEQEVLAIRVSEILEPKISEMIKEHLADFIIRVVDKESKVFEEIEEYITRGVSNIVEAYIDDNLDETMINEECATSIKQLAENYDMDEVARDEVAHVIRNEDFTQVIEKEVEQEVARHSVEDVMNEQITSDLDDIDIRDKVDLMIEEKIEEEINDIDINEKVDNIIEQKMELKTAKQVEKIT